VLTHKGLGNQAALDSVVDFRHAGDTVNAFQAALAPVSVRTCLGAHQLPKNITNVMPGPHQSATMPPERRHDLERTLAYQESRDPVSGETQV
jgi:hypothetical protein